MADAWEAETGEFARHLEMVQGASVHTLRAYTGDLRALATYARAHGLARPQDVTLADLRGWLGEQAAAGAARGTLARRTASCRAFFAWAARTRRIAVDPAARLASPKRRQGLPSVLKADQAAQMLAGAEVAGDDDDPVHLRNRALLELELRRRALRSPD